MLVRLRLAARRLTRSAPAPRAVLCSRRWASHDSHDHHTEPAGDVYTHETFFNPFWGTVAVFAVGSYVYVNYWPAPAPGEQPYLTKLLDRALRPGDNAVGIESNVTHSEYANIAADRRREVTEAQRPPIHRYRYKGMWDHGSPYNIPVGSQTDMSDLEVKTFEDFYNEKKK